MYLVKFDDSGESDGIFYFTMEFCDRVSVVHLMEKRGGKLGVEELEGVVDPMLEILTSIYF